MRGVLAGGLVAVLVASTLALGMPSPAVAAVAPGVPPDVLSECAASEGAGGWDARDVVSTGTGGTNSALPIRPMLVRLGEPCYLGPENEMGPTWENSLAVVLQDRTAPVPILDEDDDGVDDGAEGDSCETSVPGPGPQLLVDFDELIYCQPRTMRISYTNGGEVTFPPGSEAGGLRYVVTSVSPGTGGAAGAVNIDIDPDYPTGLQWRSVRLDLVCEHNDTGALQTGSGWSSGTWTIEPPDDDSASMPCANANYSPLALVSNRFIGTGTGRLAYISWHRDLEPVTSGSGVYGGTQAAGVQWGNVGDGTHAVCATNYSGTAGVVTHDMAAVMTIYGSPDEEEDGYWGRTQAVAFPLDKSECAFLLELVVTICAFVGYGEGLDCGVYTWDADRYRDGAPYGGDDDPTVELCTTFPDSPGCYAVLNPSTDEELIVCLIEAEGDFFTFFGQWVADVPDWVACMIFPVGWDRGGKIEAAWSHGATGEFQGALLAAVPDGIACGEVAEIGILSESIVLDTCDADFAPDWAKNVVGWVIVLGLAVLGIRRVLWAVGS